MYIQEAMIRAEAVNKIRHDEAERYKARMEKQAQLRKEYMLLNAQIRDSKKLEEEMNNIEVLQVTIIIYSGWKRYLGTYYVRPVYTFTRTTI